MKVQKIAPGPVGVCRKRVKGWRMPANTKCVTRPGRFGNPFYVAAKPEKPGDPFWRKTSEEAVEEFERMVLGSPDLCALIRRELRGFHLACYCPLGAACHRDVLLRIANAQ